MTTRNKRVLSCIQSQPWAILPDSLRDIHMIANRTVSEPLEAIEKRIGKPLQNTRSVTIRKGVAIIPVTGPIFRYANLFTEISGATSSQELAREIGEAVDNKDVKAIILDVDSPGGEAFGVEELSDLVFEARKKKPIYTHVGGYNASAAYFVTSGAMEIYGAPNSMTGSIGAVMVARVGNDEREIEIVSAKSPMKRPDPATDEGRGAYQTLVDDLAEVFIARVARNRGVSVETVESHFGQGGLMIAHKAAEAGLIDGVMNFEDLLLMVSEGKTKPKTVTVHKGEPTMSNENQTQPTQKPLTLEALQTQHKELYEQVKQIGFTEGKTQGATEEMTRIKGVHEQMMPGHEELVLQLMFDGKTTGPEAAVQILAAEKKNRGDAHQTFIQEAPKPVPQSVDDESEEETPNLDALPLEEKAQKMWDEGHPVAKKSGCATFQGFLGYMKALEKGAIQ